VEARIDEMDGKDMVEMGGDEEIGGVMVEEAS